MATQESAPPGWRTVLDLAVSVAVLIVAGVIVWSFLTRPIAGAPTTGAPRELPIPLDPVSVEGSAVIGAREASLILIEYSDFQCPYCASFARDTLPLIRKKYIDTGQVRLAFKHLPLPMHQNAVSAAEASECAARQGQFWRMHDWLFANATRLDKVATDGVSDVGLDAIGFSDCIAEGLTAAKVRQDRAEAKSLQITSTPTFLLGKVQPDGRVSIIIRRIPGAVPPEVFSRAIEDALRRTGS